MSLKCPICTRPRDARYVNSSAGEECVHPCHWPYLSSQEVARASQVLDRITYVNGKALRAVWEA